MYTKEELINDLRCQSTFMDIIRWFEAFEPELLELGNSTQGSRTSTKFVLSKFIAERWRGGWDCRIYVSVSLNAKYGAQYVKQILWKLDMTPHLDI
jgi:hypothetical protein